jgi:hypothetical protein
MAISLRGYSRFGGALDATDDRNSGKASISHAARLHGPDRSIALLKGSAV